MTKRKKILICCILTALLTILTIVPIFAFSYLPTNVPNDIGIKVTDTNHLPNGFYYLKVIVTNTISEEYAKFYYQYQDSANSEISSFYLTNKIFYHDYTNVNTQFVVRPIYTSPNIGNPIAWQYNDNVTTYYFAFAIASNVNSGFYVNLEILSDYVELYTLEYTYVDIDYAFMQGYLNGYDEGLITGQNIQQYTNLVGYVEQLIGQFTGSSAAQYITPIAIVLVVLFVYFLFIRFLLSLVKAKGIIKTCDIIMIVACIIMLIVMYAPMLDLTIKTEQINSSEETTETVQINRSNIYVESTETGDIYHGPVGTAIVTKSETIEDIYKISEDIETEAIAYEKD